MSDGLPLASFASPLLLVGVVDFSPLAAIASPLPLVDAAD